jgi:hypothetical protein
MKDRLFALVKVLFIIFTALVASGGAQATETASLSGRVFNGVTGAGYAGVAIELCDLGRVVTDAQGAWELTVPSGSAYCARLGVGAPTGLSGPLTRNNNAVWGQVSYEHQVAGMNCFQSEICTPERRQWDRAIDGGLDFVYGLEAAAPAVTPTPTPMLTPAPVPAATQQAVSVKPAGSGFWAVTSWKFGRGWLDFGAVLLVLAGVVVAVLVVPIRTQRKLSYQEYLRSKYYNL